MAERALAAAGEQTVVSSTETAAAPVIARLAAQLLDLDGRSRTSTPFSGSGSAPIPTGRGPLVSTGSAPSSGRSCSPTPALTCERCSATLAGWPLTPSPGTPRLRPGRGKPASPEALPPGLRRVFYLAAFSAINATASPAPTTSANEPRGSATPRPWSPWPADWSTSSGPCPATVASSPQPRHSPLPRRIDTILETLSEDLRQPWGAALH
jgi:hypothetical protein